MTTPMKRPYRGPDRRIPLQREPGNPLGFVRTLKGKAEQLRREASGLLDRMRYQRKNGVPAAYQNEKVFQPEREIVNVLVENFPGVALSVAANRVVRDAVEHEIPIMIPGPGVFVARYLSVDFYQRIWGGTNTTPSGMRAYQYAIPIGKSFNNTASGLAGAGPTMARQTEKFSLPRNLLPTYVADRTQVGICFHWNLIDQDSGRKFSDDWLPHEVLLPGGFQNQSNGNLFEFFCPWIFERAGVLSFVFRLTTPILQMDSATAVGPFGVDDREGGLRNQSVRVCAELHGTKHYENRDLLLREAM